MSELNQNVSSPALAPPATPVEVNDFKNLAADLLADVLAHGSHPEVLSKLAESLLLHQGHASYQQPPEEIKKSTRDYVSHQLPSWVRALQDGAKPRRKFDTGTEAKSISDRVRASFRERLASALQEFLRHPDPEDVMFMLYVLEEHSSKSGFPGADRFAPCPIVEAFEVAIADGSGYVRCPSELKEALEAQVARYVREHM